MKKTLVTTLSFVLMLSAHSVWTRDLLAQDPAQIREYQEKVEQMARGREEARQAHLQEIRAHVRETRSHLEETRSRIREHLAEIEGHQTQERRERAQGALERAEQVVVRIRSRARIGVSLDVRQGREYDRQGVLVKGFTDDSPAEEAGLEDGDIITHLGGRSLAEPLPEEEEGALDEYQSLPVQRLMALARELEDGEEVEIRYIRDGQSRRVTLEAADVEGSWTTGGGSAWSFRAPEAGVWAPGERRLEEFDVRVPDILVPEIHLEGIYPGRDPEDREIGIFRGGENLRIMGYGAPAFHGLSLQDLTPELGAYFSADEGVLVLESEEGSELGLLPGDVIRAVDGREVEDRGDVIRILRSYEEGEAVSFLVIRHGQETRVQGTME